MLTEILATLEKHRAESPQEVPNKVPNKIHDKAADKLKVAYPGMADCIKVSVANYNQLKWYVFMNYN